MKTQTELSQNLLRSLALMQHNGEDYFISGENAYEGTEERAKEEFEEFIEGLDKNERKNAPSFDEYCAANCTQIDELDAEDFDYNDKYLVLTDEEADEKCAECIKDSLWTFNASFIIEHSKLPYEAEEMLKTFQEQKCESANDTVAAMIEDIDEFIEDAISADGRGHFMNTYDGNENEETVNGKTFYIYRMN